MESMSKAPLVHSAHRGQRVPYLNLQRLHDTMEIRMGCLKKKHGIDEDLVHGAETLKPVGKSFPWSRDSLRSSLQIKPCRYVLKYKC